MKGLAGAFVALLLLTTLPTPIPAQAAGEVSDYTITVDGQTAHGLVATPAGTPLGLVVVAHGYTHTAESHRGHLSELAARGFVAVAMDYRGDIDGFPLSAGAADTMAATGDLAATFGFDAGILYSVSMGTAVAGIVLAEMPGFFTYWVDNEGLAMLHETWAGASALEGSGNPTAVNAKHGIEAETGGTPATHLEAYLARSAVYRAAEFAGLQGVILTHGLNDGLVPYNQGREMQAALAAQGIATDFYTAIRGNEGGEGTTLTGYGGVNVDGVAGHGTESNDAHTLTALSFDLLYRLVEGDASVVPAGREVVVDRDFGVLP